MDSSVLTPTEKLNILERYFSDVARQIKAGYSKHRGTGKFIGYRIKGVYNKLSKTCSDYDTGRIVLQQDPQTVQRYELKEDYIVYDTAIINLTEKQLIERIAERVSELKEVYEDVYLIRMDENMHRKSAKNNKLKLHQFRSG